MVALEYWMVFWFTNGEAKGTIVVSFSLLFGSIFGWVHTNVNTYDKVKRRRQYYVLHFDNIICFAAVDATSATSSEYRSPHFQGIKLAHNFKAFDMHHVHT